MHKDFYASGFLYHPVSQQILLQQNSVVSPASSPWTLLGTTYKESENPEAILKDIILDLLDIQITTILPIYSYSGEDKEPSQYIGYTIAKTKKDFSPKNGFSFAWFSFKDVLKLQITPQTKHDIVVGQRVIEAAERKRLGQHTF